VVVDRIDNVYRYYHHLDGGGIYVVESSEIVVMNPRKRNPLVNYYLTFDSYHLVDQICDFHHVLMVRERTELLLNRN